MYILQTNDDGIRAPGLLALYRELTALGDIAVVAPEQVQSAAGHGITLSLPLLTEKVTVENGFEGISVDGRPADCVKLAVDQLLPRRPDLVVSGMNLGANTGINVVYSGTVAAAIEAAFLGLPAIAVSLHMIKGLDLPDYAWAAKWGAQVVRMVWERGLHGGQVISINLPALKVGQEPAGVTVCRQCIQPWPDTYDRRKDPRGRDYFWNSSIFSLATTDTDTDVAAVRDKYIAVTPLQFDLTNYSLLKDLQAHAWPL